MVAHLSNASERPDATIDELSLVALRHPFTVPGDGRSLPAGTMGTVVAVLEPDAAFIVEFGKPFAALVDLAFDHLVAVPGESRADLAAGQLARRAP